MDLGSMVCCPQTVRGIAAVVSLAVTNVRVTVDGLVRAIEGYACALNAADVVNVELWEGQPPTRLITALTANLQKLGDTDILGPPGQVCCFVG
jgi:hypothetical protein